MNILGIDPGTTAIGYAVLEVGQTLCCLEADLIQIHSATPSERLIELQRGIQKLLRKWKPTTLALERLFFAKNQKTALAVAEARGVILLTTALAGLKLYEYTPLEVKKTVTGDGRADKLQLKKMVQLSLPDSVPSHARDDVFDAIGIALTCYFLERHHFTKTQP